MEPPGVVFLDECRELLGDVLGSLEFERVDALDLQRLHEAFGPGVVVGVSVDGVPQGPASNWPGGLRAAGPRNLQLSPGQHTIRIEAPGYQPFEVTVVVRPNAPRKSQTIHYRLER